MWQFIGRVANFCDLSNSAIFRSYPDNHLGLREKLVSAHPDIDCTWKSTAKATFIRTDSALSVACVARASRIKYARNVKRPELAFQDAAGDAGDQLEGVLGPNSCHILAQRANISHPASVHFCLWSFLPLVK